MKKKANPKNIFKNKKTIILIVIIIILLIIEIVLSIQKKDSTVIEGSYLEKFESVKQIIEYYESEFIAEKNSKDINYYKDIYVDFKYNTFEQEESKQRFYENIIGNVYQFISSNYRLIDEEKDLTIEVIGDINSDRLSYYYLINGQENYFENEESRLSLINYEEDKKTKLEMNSEIIKQLVENKWNANINFGTKESTFENYDIYFDEGIEVRKISGKVFNIVFTNKYLNEIVNGIKVGETNANIIRKLGNPTYGNEESTVIGYQSEDMYIFFSNSEISIYRNEKYDTKEFEKLLSKYIEKEMDIKEFMNELTYVWDDYSKYAYDSNYIQIRYPLKGLEINMTSDSSKGVKIFNNYSKTEKIIKAIKDGKITAKFEENLVYIDEKDRQAIKDGYLYLCDMAKQEREMKNKQIGKDSKKYSYYTTQNEINFISIDKENPNETISEQVNTGFWYNDNIFVYSVIDKGIYSYDLVTKVKSTLLEGNEKFTFDSYDNNVIRYDDGKQIQISN